MEPIILLIAIVVLIYAVLAFLYPRMAIYLLIFFSIFDLGFFSRWIHVSKYFARIPFLIAGLLVLIFMLSFFSEKLKIRRTDKEVILSLKFILFLSFIAVLSCLYNRESLVLGLFELRYFYMFAIFLISFKYYLSRFTTIKNFILFFVIIGLLQIPFTAIQYTIVQIIGIRLSQSALDISSGTFSAYPSLVFVQCVAIACILEYQLNFNKPLLKINNYSVMVLLIVPFLLSYSRISMGYAVLSVTFVFSTDMFRNKNPGKVVKRLIGLVAICSVFLFLFLHFFYNPHNFTRQLEKGYVVDYFMAEPRSYEQYRAVGHMAGEMGRGRAIVEAINLVSANFITFFIGMGSGSSSEASFIGKSGKYFYKYGPMAGIGRVQFSKTLVELGFAGVFIVVFFLVKVFIIAKRHREKKNVINRIFIDLMFIVFLSSLYERILMTEIGMLTIAFIVAIISRGTSGKKYL